MSSRGKACAVVGLVKLRNARSVTAMSVAEFGRAKTVRVIEGARVCGGQKDFIISRNRTEEMAGGCIERDREGTT